MKYLFLDSNIFIHFIDFEQINWEDLLETKGKITIVIAPIVIEELDKNKYNKNQKISQRIKKLFPKLEDVTRGNRPSKYPVIIINNRPKDITFEGNQLDRNEQDDKLLATIIEFQQALEGIGSITYVTNDYGPRFKALSLKIDTFKLPDQYMHLNEPDELVSLKKELTELKYLIPKVSLTFREGGDLASFKIDTIDSTIERYIKNSMKKVQEQNPYLEYTPSDKGKSENPLDQLNRVFELTENQIKSYNAELKKYFDEYRKFLESQYHNYLFKKNCIKICLKLINTGTSPAEDIDVETHFPDGFELYEKEDLPKDKRSPTLPYKPKSKFDFKPLFAERIASPYSQDVSSILLLRPIIKKTNSYEVSHHVKTLKQSQEYEFEPLYLKFENIQKAKGFTINYRLIISNVPKPIIGTLNIKMEK